MLYFAPQNLVFLANPKTGTTAIEKALSQQASIVVRSPSAMRHMNVATYRRVLEPYLARQAGRTPRVFLVVREPVQRLLSWYRYRRRTEVAGSPKSAAHLTPDEFLEETMKPVPAACARIGSQARFVGAAAGADVPAILFPYGHPAPLAGFLAEEFGVADVKPANVSPRETLEVDPDVAARVRAHRAGECALYARTLDRWGLAQTP